MFWTAPEFLVNNQQNERTKAGDVYSYGIIMKEICSRCDPYEEASLSPTGTNVLIYNDKQTQRASVSCLI